MKPKIEINKMSREQLAACYVENIGYDPFYKCEITQIEVAKIPNEYFDEVGATAPAPLTREEQIFRFREEDAS